MIEKLKIPDKDTRKQVRELAKYCYGQFIAGNVAHLKDALTKHSNDNDTLGDFWRDVKRKPNEKLPLNQYDYLVNRLAYYLLQDQQLLVPKNVKRAKSGEYDYQVHLHNLDYCVSWDKLLLAIRILGDDLIN